MDTNTYIKNPKTGRPVRVGSNVWYKLIRQGILEKPEEFNDPNIMKPISEDTSIEEQIKQVDRDLEEAGESDYQSVRGRGKYQGFIVKRQKAVNPHKIARETASAATRAVTRNLEKLSNSDDIEGDLERLIMEQLAFGETNYSPKKVSKKASTQKKKTKKKTKWIIEESSSSESSEDSSSSDESEFEW